VPRRTFEPKEYEESVINIDRVTKVVKGGKKMKFRVLVVVGNKKGKVGIGIGKAVEIPQAIQKGVTAAKRNLVTVTLKGTTLPFSTKTRTGAGWVYLQPAINRHGYRCRRRRASDHGEGRRAGRADEVAGQFQCDLSGHCHHGRIAGHRTDDPDA